MAVCCIARGMEGLTGSMSNGRQRAWVSRAVRDGHTDINQRPQHSFISAPSQHFFLARCVKAEGKGNNGTGPEGWSWGTKPR